MSNKSVFGDIFNFNQIMWILHLECIFVVHQRFSLNLFCKSITEGGWMINFLGPK